MTRSSPILSRRKCPGSAKGWPSLAATWRSAACGASAIFSGWRRGDDVDHQDADAFARRRRNRNLSRLAQHRDLAGDDARTRLTFCQAAAAILDHATVVDTDRGLITRSSEGLEELKSASPDLWYLVSYDNLIN